MKNVSNWLSIMWLPASILFAQEAAVTVVFAPEYAQKSPPAPPMRFEASGGTVGIRLGEKSMMAAVVTAGAGGKLQVQCVRPLEAEQKLKAARGQSVRKDSGNAK